MVIDLKRVFTNNFDCYTEVTYANGWKEDEPAMTLEKFEEVVREILKEKESE